MTRTQSYNGFYRIKNVLCWIALFVWLLVVIILGIGVYGQPYRNFFPNVEIYQDVFLIQAMFICFGYPPLALAFQAPAALAQYLIEGFIKIDDEGISNASWAALADIKRRLRVRQYLIRIFSWLIVIAALTLIRHNNVIVVDNFYSRVHHHVQAFIFPGFSRVLEALDAGGAVEVGAIVISYCVISVSVLLVYILFIVDYYKNYRTKLIQKFVLMLGESEVVSLLEYDLKMAIAGERWLDVGRITTACLFPLRHDCMSFNDVDWAARNLQQSPSGQPP